MGLVFFDTEFNEDGKTIELISIGLVKENGEELYCESSEFDEESCNDFVKQNVLTKLGPKEGRLSKDQIKQKILDFIGSEIPTWVAYYASYDHVVLAQIFGRMVDLPEGWDKFCWDLKQEMRMRGNIKAPDQDQKGEHNALADAKWNKQTYDWMNKKYGVVIPDKVPEPIEVSDDEPKEESSIFAFYGQIKEEVLGEKVVLVEAIGDNSVDNMIEELSRAAEIEIGNFTAALLNSSVQGFEYAYTAPNYEGFKVALKNLIERYRLMDGTEQGDIIAKISILFKNIFVSKYGSLGPEAAELIAVRYAKQMVDYIKSENIQQADLAIDASQKVY